MVIDSSSSSAPFLELKPRCLVHSLPRSKRSQSYRQFVNGSWNRNEQLHLANVYYLLSFFAQLKRTVCCVSLSKLHLRLRQLTYVCTKPHIVTEAYIDASMLCHSKCLLFVNCHMELLNFSISKSRA